MARQQFTFLVSGNGMKTLRRIMRRANINGIARLCEKALTLYACAVDAIHDGAELRIVHKDGRSETVVNILDGEDEGTGKVVKGPKLTVIDGGKQDDETP